MASRRVTEIPSCIKRERNRTPHRGAVRTLFRVFSKFSGEHSRGIWRATGNTQLQVATSILKSNADAEKSAVLTLLGAGQPALVGAGIGGNLDVTA